MPSISVLESDVVRIARFVRRRREALKITQKELARRCTRALRAAGVPNAVTSTRIAKIEGAASARPAIGSARWISPFEIHALGEALNAPPELLRGLDMNIGALWDPLMNSQLAEHVLALFEEVESSAEDLLAWDAFLPCSLVTPEVMHSHHALLHRDLPDEYREKAIELYDTIGDRRREWLHQRKLRSPIWEIVFAADIERLAFGTNAYTLCDRGQRIDCMANLISIISDARLNMHLAVHVTTPVDAAIEQHLTGKDTLLVFGDKLAVWRDITAQLFWSTRPHIVKLHRNFLLEFRNAAVSAQHDVMAFLGALIGRL